MSDLILDVQHIHTFINEFQILEGVNFGVPRNRITVLLGRNGAGKTTTLRSILGLTPATSGAIVFNDVPIQDKRAFQIAQMGVGFVPDYRAIFRDLTVEENLVVAERGKGDLARKQATIFDVFPDLEKLYQWPGGQLSGGQQQMLAVARALVPDNQLLLIDEPSEGLAPVIVEQMMAAIRTLSETTTILLVEQNFRVASLLADHFVIIEDGRSVEHGEMADLAANDAMITKYLSAA